MPAVPLYKTRGALLSGLAALALLVSVLPVSGQERRYPAAPAMSRSRIRAARRTPPIRIGLLIPRAGNYWAEAQAIRRGVEMALSEANAIPGKERFEMIVRADDGPWASGSRQMVRLAFEDRVSALIGGVESMEAHLIAQVAVKSRVVYITPWTGDRTLTQAGVPWVFRCVPHDEQLAQALVRRIFTVQQMNRVGVLSTDDRSARLFAGAFLRAADRAGRPIPSYLRHRIQDTGDKTSFLSDTLEWISHERPEGVAVFAPIHTTVKIGNVLRQRRVPTKIVSATSLLSYETGFQRAYRARYGIAPIPPAAFAYDAARLLIDAVRGLPPAVRRDRAAIRSAVARIRFQGVTGTTRFDTHGNRTGNESFWTSTAR
jgi:branched-chain amino acid transport system substrate-binding protein